MVAFPERLHTVAHSVQEWVLTVFISPFGLESSQVFASQLTIMEVIAIAAATIVAPDTVVIRFVASFVVEYV